MAETRRRIVEAAVELHTSVGPARTAIAAIAERAGVQRHTVYAHFPDRVSLFRACSAHWRERHPFPDLSHVETIELPEERLRAGLGALYGWYERVEQDLALFLRDADAVPPGLQAEDAQRYAFLVATLARGWPRRAPVRAAIGHSAEFETWRSLCRRHRLSRRAAVDSMVSLAASV